MCAGENREMGEEGVNDWYYSLHTTVFMLIRLNQRDVYFTKRGYYNIIDS